MYTYASREDKIKLMVDQISTVYSLCREKALGGSRHAEYKNFWGKMEVIYEKVLLTNARGVTSLNYSLSGRVVTEVERLLNESYSVFLEMRELYLNKRQHLVYKSLECAAVFLNTVMNRLDDGKEWKVEMKDGCWWMLGADGTLQRITVENPMLEVAYTSWRAGGSNMTS